MAGGPRSSRRPRIAGDSVLLSGRDSGPGGGFPHSPRPARVTAERDIQHARQLRAYPASAGAARTAAGADGRKPGAAGPWTLAVPAIGLTAGVMTLGGPHGPGAAWTASSLPVPPLARAATVSRVVPVHRRAGGGGQRGHRGARRHLQRPRGVLQPLPAAPGRPGLPERRRRPGSASDVNWVRELPKPRFPVNQVFGGTQRHMLWLITCGGEFDDKTRHYLDNIVVSATWVPPAAKHPGKPEKSGAKRISRSSRNGALVAIIVSAGPSTEPGLPCIPP